MKSVTVSNAATEKKGHSYEAPAVVYEGEISTRAGTPVAAPDGLAPGINPSDLFND